MRMRWFAIVTLMAALGLFTSTALADHGKGKGHGKGKPHAAARHDRDDRDDDKRWEHHDRYDVRVYEVREGRPPGWSEGRKAGWGDCGLPPGQAKKYGCRTYVYENRRYYYYRDDIGRIIVRRPRIEIHAIIQ